MPRFPEKPQSVPECICKATVSNINCPYLQLEKDDIVEEVKFFDATSSR